MTNEKNKRILDKDFTDGITGRAGEIKRDAEGRMGQYQKGAQESIGKAQKGAQESVTKAQKYAHKKNEEVEAEIKKHPKAYVAGAIAVGAIAGAATVALLSKKKKD
jgi:hypothetical protein